MNCIARGEGGWRYPSPKWHFLGSFRVSMPLLAQGGPFNYSAAILDKAKIRSGKLTYVSIRPELCPILLLGQLIRKILFFFAHQSLPAPLVTMGFTIEKEQKWEIHVFS